MLAIQVAQVDAMSGGRVELGLGAGWFKEEHTALGIDFPTVGKRFDRLTEQLQIVTGLWRTPPGETFSHDGPEYTLVDNPALPKPVQKTLPLIVGGTGPRRTPGLAARFANEFNLAFANVESTAAAFARVRMACHRIGRSTDELTWSIALTLCCGRNDAEVTRRADAIGRSTQDLRANGAAGTPAEVVERLGEFAAVGVQRVYLQVLDLSDLDQLDLVAADVAPKVTSS